MKDLRNAWLSPNGELIDDHNNMQYGGSFHLDLGICILGDILKFNTKEINDYIFDNPKFNYSPVEDLENRGWIRLHGFGGMTPKWVVPYRHKVTNLQEMIILEWCIANKKNYHLCFHKH